MLPAAAPDWDATRSAWTGLTADITVASQRAKAENHGLPQPHRPEFPERFGSLEHGRSSCGDFFPWYNTEHHHVGLGLFTPHDVHYGLAATKREQRARVLAAAYARHPERFPQGLPLPKAVPTAVWINPPANVADPSRIENTMAQKSRKVAIVDAGVSYEADSRLIASGAESIDPPPAATSVSESRR